MRKIHVGDDLNLDKEQKEEETIKNIDELKKKVKQMNVYADVVALTTNKAVVITRDHIGTSLYFSSATDDNFWLSRHSKKRERKGDTTVYYFDFSGVK